MHNNSAYFDTHRNFPSIPSATDACSPNFRFLYTLRSQLSINVLATVNVTAARGPQLRPRFRLFALERDTTYG